MHFAVAVLEFIARLGRRVWPKADTSSYIAHVRFRGQSGHGHVWIIGVPRVD